MINDIDTKLFYVKYVKIIKEMWNNILLFKSLIN